VGSAAAVAALGKIKTNIDSGIFRAVQHAGIAALDGPQEMLTERLRIYQARRDRAIQTLRALGWDPPDLLATFYIWLPVPDGSTSVQFAARVLDRTGVVMTPGAGYGTQGDGYVRISFTISDARLDEALRRLRDAFGKTRPAAVGESQSRGR
jgi:LL-diaminopimelate aminotransferase